MFEGISPEAFTKTGYEIAKLFGLSEEQIVLLAKEVMDDLKDAKNNPTPPDTLYLTHSDYTGMKWLKRNSWQLLSFGDRCLDGVRTRVLSESEAKGVAQELPWRSPIMMGR